LSALAFNCARAKEAAGFTTRDGIVEIINVQPRNGGQAKPYQVKQVRELLLKYRIDIE